MSEPDQHADRPDRKRPSIEDVFGDVLPELTADERAPRPDDGRPDSWYEDNRPPHHDRT